MLTLPTNALSRSSVPNNDTLLTEAAMSDRFHQSYEQASYESEPSSYFRSATSSPAATFAPSEITSCSSMESPVEDNNISSALIAACLKLQPGNDLKQVEGQAEAPLLKGAGKSDCSVCVVSIHECEKDLPVASVSDENSAWNSEKMQAILEHARSVVEAPEATRSQDGSRAARVQKALRRPTLPHRNRSAQLDLEILQSKISSPRQYVNEKTLRRLSSGMWAVRKQAFRSGKQDGSRLLKQIQKQVIYSATCRTNPIISMIGTPEVYGLRVPEGEDAEGSIIVDMEYIPFNDVRSLILEQDKTIHNWFIGSAISVIDQEMTQSSIVKLGTVLPEFNKKASGIIAHLANCPLLAPREKETIAQYFSIILTRFQSFQDLQIPVGTCHGDLTLQNMLVDPINRELCVFDFLDSFVESPLQDIAKLLQDCRHQWFFTQTEISAKDTARVATTLESFNTRICSAYYNYKFWEAVPLFEFFTLARILPYMTQENEKQCIINGLCRIIEDLYQTRYPKVSSSNNGERKMEGSSTVIVPALGCDMGRLYRDGEVKLLAKKSNGRPLIVDCISNLAVNNVSAIIVAVTRPLILEYCITTTRFEDMFRCLGEEKYHKLRFFYSEEQTQDAVETVTIAIESCSIQGPVFVKAADNGFTHSVDIGNYLSVAEVLNNRTPIKSPGHAFRPDLVDVTEKNFVSFSYDNVVSNIAYKKDVSSQFCCGGWSFLEASEFVFAAAKLRSLVQTAREISMTGSHQSPLRIVDSIWQLMSQGHLFFGVKVDGYDDCGSQAAWIASRGRDLIY